MLRLSFPYFGNQVLDCAATRNEPVDDNDVMLAICEKRTSVGCHDQRAHAFQPVGAAIPLDVLSLDALSFSLAEFDHWDSS